MVDEEDPYDLWEDLPSRKNLVTSLIKSFVVWVIVVVFPSLVIAAIAWLLMYFAPIVGNADRAFLLGFAFGIALVFFWKK